MRTSFVLPWLGGACVQAEVARRRAEKTIGHFLVGTRRIHEAKKYTAELRQQRLAMVVLFEMQAKEKVARLLQARWVVTPPSGSS